MCFKISSLGWKEKVRNLVSCQRKDKQTDRQRLCRTSFCLWVKQRPLGFIACYFIFSCFVGTDGVYSLLTYVRFLCII